MELSREDVEALRDLLESMEKYELEKVGVKTLTLYQRETLYKLGYSDQDAITREEVANLLGTVEVDINVDTDTKNIQVSKGIQEGLDTLSTEISKYPTDGYSENSDMKAGKENTAVLLKAIKEVIDTIDRPYKVVPFYVLLLYDEISAQELKEKTLKYAEELLGQPLAHNSLKMAMAAVNKSSMIYKRRDDITGVKYYRLMEKTKDVILNRYVALLHEHEVLQRQEELKQAEKEKVIEAAIDFYENVYRDRVIELATFSRRKYLLVDWGELRAYNPELAEFVVKKPEDAIEAFETALKVFRKDFLFLEPGEYAVHFTSVGDPVRVKGLRDRQFGELVTVRAMVSGVTSKKKLFYERMVFVCQECGWETVRIQDPIAKVEWPGKCDACGSRNLKVDPRKSVVKDIIFFTLQDMVEDLGNKEQPSKISAYMLRPDVSLSPGDRVLVTGILRDTVHKSRKQNNDMVLEVLHVEFLDDFGARELSEEDVAEVRNLRERYGDELPDAVARSLAPQIFADKELLPELWFFKKAVVYAIASPKDLGPGDERLWINVLAVGDKGTGKSRIIRDIQNITVAVYGDGANLSGAGLIGMPEREELTGEWVFRGGLMVRANGFVLALDEFEKAKAEDYARMHSGMSYGLVPFSKASISTTLKTMESVVAAANPVGGYFNSYKGVFEQITLPSSLLDRFDVIFVLRQPRSERVIEAIYEHQDKFEAGEIQREIPEELLRKLFLYVRELRPTFTEEARQEIKRFGMAVNRALANAGFKYSMRLRGILKRLAMANALLRLSEVVELKDVLAAEEVFTAAIRSWGDGDVDWSVFGEIEAQASREELELLRKVEEVMGKLHDYYTKVPEREVLDWLKSLGLEEEKARYALEVARERGLIVESDGGWILSSRA
ncbi:MAG: minichromosome maintenance protein MCM [Thermotogae bacterium]|nr:minichromosome maintenance protein MCM [Thermotogota bacterium]